MERINLVKAEFNVETGVSTVTIDTELGRFTGTSVTRAEDKPYISSYQGCKYAEIKAIRKFLRAQLKAQKIELQVLKSLRNAFDSSNKCFTQNREWKILLKAIYQKEDQIAATKNNIEKLSKHLLEMIKVRDDIVNRIHKSADKTN